MATYNVTITVEIEDKAEFLAWAAGLAKEKGWTRPKAVIDALAMCSARLADADGITIVDEDVSVEDDED